MSVFTISDLHLSLGTDKPMEVFGWDNYVKRIESNWKRLVKNEDTVVIPGDFSWALKLEESLEDFKFLNSLPGKKLLLKGNHDLWWSTVKKVNEFLGENRCNQAIIFVENALLEEATVKEYEQVKLLSVEDDNKISALEKVLK